MAFWSTSIPNGKALFYTTTLPESTTSLCNSNSCKGRHWVSARLANPQTPPSVSCKSAVGKVSVEAFPTLMAYLHLMTTELTGQFLPNFVFRWIDHASAITLAAEWDFISDVMGNDFCMASPVICLIRIWSWPTRDA